MKLTNDTFRPYKDVLVDLLIDNLNDGESSRAKEIGETIRKVQRCINRGTELPKSVVDSISHIEV